MEIMEILGWVATIVIIVSFLIDDMLWLRLMNLIGASLWFIYAIITNQPSILVLNLVIIGIQLWKIIGLLKLNKK
jgi:hypothetical protein